MFSWCMRSLIDSSSRIAVILTLRQYVVSIRLVCIQWLLHIRTLWLYQCHFGPSLGTSHMPTAGMVAPLVWSCTRGCDWGCCLADTENPCGICEDSALISIVENCSSIANANVHPQNPLQSSVTSSHNYIRQIYWSRLTLPRHKDVHTLWVQSCYQVFPLPKVITPGDKYQLPSIIYPQ